MRVLLFLFLAIFSLNANYNCENCENLDPKKIEKVYASNPVILYQLYAVDKSKVAGLVFEFWDIEKEFLDENFTSLPVVGGFFGQGRTPNIEQVLALRPDLILASTNTTELYQNIFKKTKIPVLYLDALTIEDSLNSFEILGKYLGVSDRAKKLKNFALNSLKFAKNLKQNVKNPKRIYYAFGDDGLQTECDKSGFGEVLNLVGAKLVHKCENLKQNSRVSLNFEQILSYDPDAITVYHKAFYDKIFSDKKWQLLKAVQNKEVYLILRKPFSWVGKPASFMRFLGIYWLGKTLYPELVSINLYDKTKEFYELFLYLDLSDDEIKDILNEKI